MVPATAALMIVIPAKSDEKETRRWAEGKTLTAGEAVQGVLAGVHADVWRSVGLWVKVILGGDGDSAAAEVDEGDEGAAEWKPKLRWLMRRMRLLSPSRRPLERLIECA